MRITATLLFILTFTAPVWAQTSAVYRKDALAVLALQQRVLAVDKSGQNKKARALCRLESARCTKFARKYANYRPGGLPPASTALLDMGDTALSQVVHEKNGGRKKPMWDQADSSMARLKTFIAQGK